MWVVATVAAVFWIVGIGCGWRGVLLLEGRTGIVGKAQAFGDGAVVWWVPAAVLTLTVAAMGIGIAVVRHLLELTEVAGTSRVDIEAERQLELPPGPADRPELETETISTSTVAAD